MLPFREDESDNNLVRNSSKLYGYDEASSRPNLALGSLLGSIPVAVIIFLVMLIANKPISQAVLISWVASLIAFFLILAWSMFRHSTDEVEQSCEATKSHDTIMVWKNYTRYNNVQHPLCIALVACDGDHSRELADNLLDLGHKVFHSKHTTRVLRRIEAQPEHWDLLVFDMDLVSDLNVGLDILIEFRSLSPSVPVLLLSSTVERDEFSGHRRVIGDATLRKPVVSDRLLDGLHATGHNFLSFHQATHDNKVLDP
ncbi:CheY-like chemotaxis protein [Roseinatronobacter monicus]|uniref:CheY-like chemotaxis protein n=2 Tax=Roseinatronobacter monicus TaxID=393481 RepID=A0A543K468_9RHOB|nr:CheY-like chemotaxis protein [Roseinatronobacter monicus]